MKIGILTFHEADNYGAVLQNYALLTCLRSCGHYVETINFRCKNILNNNALNILPRSRVSYLGGCKELISNLIHHSSRVYKHKMFESFRHEKLCLTDPFSPKKNDKIVGEYDCIIVGSDQVWNSKIVGEDIHTFFLDFFAGIKIAYAASSGSTNLFPDTQIAQLKKFSDVFVREASLCEYLKKRGVNNSVVMDPVFLLSKEEWLREIGTERKVKDPYLFFYFVGNNIDESIAIAKKVAKEKGIKIVTLERTLKLPEAMVFTASSPFDFIRLVRDAEFVVASSFHATAFSVLFEKEFVSVPHRITGSRIEDLLHYLGFEKYIVYSDKERIDYNLFAENKILINAVNVSKQKLIDALNKYFVC